MGSCTSDTNFSPKKTGINCQRRNRQIETVFSPKKTGTNFQNNVQTESFIRRRRIEKFYNQKKKK
jgi:hypothetical protein